MRNVQRLKKPKSLAKNGPKWSAALQAKIVACGGVVKLVPNKYFDKYNKPDIKESLREMYGGLCCYCEARIGVVEFGNIEHTKPKRTYTDTTYEWENLHLACTMCNVEKGIQYDEISPILDAVKDRPIEDHLTYRKYWVQARTARGTTTRNHVKLDREGLLRARSEIWTRVLGLIEEINRTPNAPESDTVRDELNELTKGEFGSLVRHAIAIFLK